MMAVVRTARVFFVRDMLMAMSYPLNFVMNLGSTLLPMLLLFLPAKLVGNPQVTQEYGGYLPYAIVGSGIMNFFVASYGIYASAIQSERGAGTLEALLMTPIRVPTIILASTAYPFVWSTITTILFIGGGALVYQVPLQGSLLLAFLIVVLTTMIFASLGVVSASFLMVFKRGDPLRPLIGTVFFLLGDIVYPIDLLPNWLKFIAQLLPVTHAAGPLRAVLLRGEGFAEVVPHLIVLLGYVLVLFPASLWLFARAVRHATRDGTLLQN